MKSAVLSEPMNCGKMMHLPSFHTAEPLSAQHEPSEQHHVSTPSFVTPQK